MMFPCWLAIMILGPGALFVLALVPSQGAHLQGEGAAFPDLFPLPASGCT